jgi:hypothetical protein
MFFYFKSIWSMEGTMPDAHIESERLSSWVVWKCHKTKVLLILNRFSTYRYGPYSQFINNKLLIDNRFEVWNERWQMRTSQTNDSANQTFENVIRGNCYKFLNDWVLIDMVHIHRRNIAFLSFEIDLNDIRNNIRCKHPK